MQSRCQRAARYQLRLDGAKKVEEDDVARVGEITVNRDVGRRSAMRDERQRVADGGNLVLGIARQTDRQGVDSGEPAETEIQGAFKVAPVALHVERHLVAIGKRMKGQCKDARNCSFEPPTKRVDERVDDRR